MHNTYPGNSDTTEPRVTSAKLLGKIKVNLQSEAVVSSRLVPPTFENIKHTIVNYSFQNKIETVSAIKGENIEAICNTGEFKNLINNSIGQKKFGLTKILARLNLLEEKLKEIAGHRIDPIEYIMSLYYRVDNGANEGLSIRGICQVFELIGIEWSNSRLQEFMSKTLQWPMRDHTEGTNVTRRKLKREAESSLIPAEKIRTEILTKEVSTQAESLLSKVDAGGTFDVGEYKRLTNTENRLKYFLQAFGFIQSPDELRKFLTDIRYPALFPQRTVSYDHVGFVLRKLFVACLSERYPKNSEQLIPDLSAKAIIGIINPRKSTTRVIRSEVDNAVKEIIYGKIERDSQNTFDITTYTELPDSKSKIGYFLHAFGFIQSPEEIVKFLEEIRNPEQLPGKIIGYRNIGYILKQLFIGCLGRKYRRDLTKLLPNFDAKTIYLIMKENNK